MLAYFAETNKASVLNQAATAASTLPDSKGTAAEQRQTFISFPFLPNWALKLGKKFASKKLSSWRSDQKLLYGRYSYVCVYKNIRKSR